MHFAALIEAGESMKDPRDLLPKQHGCDFDPAGGDAGDRARPAGLQLHGRLLRGAGDDTDSRGRQAAPTNAYGESKLLVEQMLRWMNRIHGLQYASLRYFNVAGAIEGYGEAHEPESHLIPLILDVALGRRANIKIFGQDYPTKDGTCVRDYIHVRDLAEAHFLALGR